MKYRSKVVEIDAQQFTGDIEELRAFAHGWIDWDLLSAGADEDSYAVWDKLHNVWVPFFLSDWIIKGTEGEFYPCTADVFAKKYEAA